MHKFISMTKIEFHNVDLVVSSVRYTRQYLSMQRNDMNRFSAERAITEHSVTTLQFDTGDFFNKLAQTHTMLTSIT